VRDADVLRQYVCDPGALINSLSGAVGLAFVTSRWLEPMLPSALRVSLDGSPAPRAGPGRAGASTNA
jgi:hypothetical protein